MPLPAWHRDEVLLHRGTGQVYAQLYCCRSASSVSAYCFPDVYRQCILVERPHLHANLALMVLEIVVPLSPICEAKVRQLRLYAEVYTIDLIIQSL